MPPRRRLGSISVDALGAGVAVISLFGEFHHREARDLERSLGDALGGAYRHLVVDMRGVDIFGALSLRALVKAAVRARERGVGFAIVRPGQDVWHAFELTGLDTEITNTGSLEAALEALPRAW